MSEQTFLTLTAEQAQRLARILDSAAAAALREERNGQTDGFDLHGLLCVTLDDERNEVNVMTEGETYDKTITGVDIDRY